MIGRGKGDFGGRAEGASIPLLLTPVQRLRQGLFSFILLSEVLLVR